MPKTSVARHAMQCNKTRISQLRELEIATATFNYRDRNSLVRRLGFPNYKAYLRSAMWQGISCEVLAKNNRCYCCDRKATEVHHREYTIETLTTVCPQLIPLCRRCHRKIEFKGDSKRFGVKKAPKVFEARPKKPKPAPLPTIIRVKPMGPTGLGRFVIERSKK